ncbi:MAG TPA: hypothetical protein VG014_00335 [Acidimicrobiales bacterium]|jgi:hypothetical protein|nr:hypothetical protein [Acidimicrobiales bacterium]
MLAEAEVETGAETAVAVPTPRSPMARLRRRRQAKSKFDVQPSQSSAVLIATVGTPIPASVIRQAVKLSGGDPVAVISIARIYGSSFGLPNPGLLPTRSEMVEQRAMVNNAIDRLERVGVEAWGQVASTRRFAKTITLAAQARGVSHVLVVTPETPRWRKFVEGDVAHDVSRKISHKISRKVTVESVPA